MSRAQKLLDGLSPDELAYFIASTDIFHDTPYTCHGRPSRSRRRQVTVCYNLERSYSLADFPSLNPANNWDLHVASFPWLTTHQFIAGVDQGTWLKPPTTGSNAGMGGVTLCATQTGSTFLPSAVFSGAFFPTSGPLTVSSTQWPSFLTALPYERYQYEVISAGYEAVNVTPTLYMSGSVIRYRVPSLGYLSTTYTPTAATTGALPITIMPAPPFNPQQATLYTDSVVGPASEGSYQMHTRQGDSNARYTDASPLELYWPTVDLTNGNVWYSRDINTKGVELSAAPNIRAEFDQVGSYFTGLSPQTVITIRYRVIISFVPMSLDTTLAALATQSPPYNPKLDELISLVQMDLPPGVPVNMNAKGDWWRGILGATAKYAPAVGAVFGPEGAALGAALSGVSTLALNATAPRPKIQPTSSGQVAPSMASQPPPPIQYTPTSALSAMRRLNNDINRSVKPKKRRIRRRRQVVSNQQYQ
jgi:hypothetical protein